MQKPLCFCLSFTYHCYCTRCRSLFENVCVVSQLLRLFVPWCSVRRQGQAVVVRSEGHRFMVCLADRHPLLLAYPERFDLCKLHLWCTSRSRGLFQGFVLSPLLRLAGVRNVVQQAAVLIFFTLCCEGKWPIGSPRWLTLRWVRSWWVKPSTSMDLNCRRYGKGSVGKRTSTKWLLSLTSVLSSSARRPWSKSSFKQAIEQSSFVCLFVLTWHCFLFVVFSFQDRGKRLKLQQFIVRNANSLFDLSFTEGQTEARKVPGEEGKSCEIILNVFSVKFWAVHWVPFFLQTAMLLFLLMRLFSLWTVQAEFDMFSRYYH